MVPFAWRERWPQVWIYTDSKVNGGLAGWLAGWLGTGRDVIEKPETRHLGQWYVEGTLQAGI